MTLQSCQQKNDVNEVKNNMVAQQMPDNKKNNVEKFFISLAGYYSVPIKYGWVSRLWSAIGKNTNISAANLMHTWISRGNIPDDSLESILSLDLPDRLKILAEACRKPKKLKTSEQRKSYATTGGWTPQTKKEDWGEMGKVYDIFKSSRKHADLLAAYADTLYKDMQSPGETLPAAPKMSDVDVLSTIISEIEKEEMSQKIKLDPDEKALVISLLYDHFVKTGEPVNRKTVARYLRLVA